MHSFEVKHDEIAQKLQNLEFLLMFSAFCIHFQFSPFFGDPWKLFSKNKSNELEFMPSFWEHIF